MRRTGESSEHGGGDDGFALLQRLVPLLDVVFKGQALFAEAQRGHTELLLEAVVGRDALGIGERRVAPPGAEDALGAVCALHALHWWHCEEQIQYNINYNSSDTWGQKVKVLKISIPPINSCVHIFFFLGL